MMANPWSGEAELVIDDQRRILKLTLGALAALEADLKSDTLIDLISRFEEGQFSTRDVVALLVAGLRGGGWDIGPKDLLESDIQGGPVEAARVAALLLGRSFSFPECAQ